MNVVYETVSALNCLSWLSLQLYEYNMTMAIRELSSKVACNIR